MARTPTQAAKTVQPLPEDGEAATVPDVKLGDKVKLKTTGEFMLYDVFTATEFTSTPNSEPITVNQFVIDKLAEGQLELA